MTEKVTSDVDYSTHNEKDLSNTPPEYVDAAEPTGRRRSSVALNIVENPLKVSLAELRLVQDVLSNIGADIYSPLSAFLQPRMSKMHASSPRPMACPNMPSSLDALQPLHASRLRESMWLRVCQMMSAPRSGTRGITSGMAQSCCGTQSVFALWEL